MTVLKNHGKIYI